METLEAKFRVSVQGKEELTSFFAAGSRDARAFSATMKKALSDTGKEIASFSKGLARDLMGVSGIKLGLAANAKEALVFRDALQQLVVSAGKGDDILGGLRSQVWDTSTAFNQLGGDVTDALQAFVEKTGDIDTARKNLALYAETATATRAAIKDVALVGVELKDKLGISDQKGAFSALVAQSKSGAIELKDLATYAPRVLSAAAAGGLTGEKGLREAGALTQVYAKAFGGRGGAASGSTSLENTFGDIIGHIGKIEGMGIQVRGRDQAEVLLDVIRKTGGDQVALSKIFNRRAIRGVNILANEYRATGRFGTYEKFLNAGGDYGEIQSDARRQMSTGLSKLKATQISIARSTDENLGDAADSLAQHSNWISASYGALTEHPLAAGAAGAAGLFGLNYLRGRVMGGRGGGGIVGGVASAVTGGGVPVMVTNWPAGFGGGGGPAAAAEGGFLGGAGKWAAGLLGGAPGAALLPAVGLAGIGYLIHRQQADVAAKKAAYEGDHPVDAEAARVFGTEYARTHRAVIRHGGMQTFDGSQPAQPEVNITIHSNENLKVKGNSGTRDPRVIDRRNGGS